MKTNEITNTGEVCERCHKRKGLHQTDSKGNHLFCYMDDSSDEFVSSKLFQSAVKETEEYKQGFKDGKIIRETARGRAYQMGFEVGKQQATKEFKENLLFSKTNHQLGCMLECYANVIQDRLGFSIEAIKLTEIASKLK